MKASIRSIAVLCAALTVALSAGPILAGSPVAARESSKTAATAKPVRRYRITLHPLPTRPASTRMVVTPPSQKTIKAPERPVLKQLLDESGVRPSQRAEAEKVLSLFPEACLENLRTFVVSYNGSLDRRGYAGKSTVMVDGTAKEFQAVLLHEMSHFWELSDCLSGTNGSPLSPFTDAGETFPLDDPSVDFYRICWTQSSVRNSTCREADFFSGYAASDNFEDLAESVAYVLLQPESAKARALTNPVLQQKYDWVMKHFPKTQIATGTPHWDGQTVPWDATRIGYSWK